MTVNDIVCPAEYVYVGVHQKCRGYRYRAERYVRAIPTYQKQILVVGLEGPDRGVSYVSSYNNFVVNFERAPEPETPEPETPEPAAERVVGHVSEPWRTGV